MLSGRHRKWLVGVVMVVASIAGLWNLSNQIVRGPCKNAEYGIAE